MGDPPESTEDHSDEIMRILKALSAQNQLVYGTGIPAGHAMLQRLQALVTPEAPGAAQRDAEPVTSQRPTSARPFLASLHVPRVGKNGRAGGANASLQAAIDTDRFRDVLRRFREYTARNGTEGLPLEPFCAALYEALEGAWDRAQLAQLFHKMDATRSGVVTWEQLLGFVMTRIQLTSDVAQGLIDDVGSRVVPAPPVTHRDAIVLIDFIARERKFLTVSRDGVISLWSPQFNIHRVIPLQDIISRTSWITDAVYLHEHSKLLVVVDDRRLCVLDILALKPRALVSVQGLEYAPTCLACHAQYTDDQTLILFGDTEGYVNVLRATRKFFIDSANDAVSSSLYDGLTPRVLQRRDALEYYGLAFYRRRAHATWVNQVHYDSNLGMFISCSGDERQALAIGDVERRTVNHVPVNKGVTAFTFAQKPIMLIAGGRDKAIRLWNPYVLTKSAATLLGHTAPISHLAVHQTDGLVVSCAEDRTIKVWSIRSLTCLQTFQDAFAHRPENRISCMYLDITGARLVTMSSRIELFPFAVKRKPEAVVPQDSAIQCMLYNAEFQQVVTATAGGVVSLWDLETGQLIFQFRDVEAAGGDSGPCAPAPLQTTPVGAPPAAVSTGETALEQANASAGNAGARRADVLTAMAMDDSGRRLITANRSGWLKVWNVNNGQLMRRYQLHDAPYITAVAYTVVGSARYILAVGWDRRTHVFLDVPPEASAAQQLELSRPFKLLDSHPTAAQEDHKDDLTALALCGPYWAVTGGADGRLVVRSLETFHVRSAMKDPALTADPHREGRAVTQLVRVPSPDDPLQARVASTHQDGFLRLWDAAASELVASLRVQGVPDESLTALVVQSVPQRPPVLFTGGMRGYVHRVRLLSDAQLQLDLAWRAHPDEVSALECLIHRSVPAVLTASTDRTIQLWTADGDHIGIFQQPVPWDLRNPHSWSPLALETQLELALDMHNGRILAPTRDHLQPDQALLVAEVRYQQAQIQARRAFLNGLMSEADAREASLASGETPEEVSSEAPPCEAPVNSTAVDSATNWEALEALIRRPHSTRYFSFDPFASSASESADDSEDRSDSDGERPNVKSAGVVRFDPATTAAVDQAPPTTVKSAKRRFLPSRQGDPVGSLPLLAAGSTPGSRAQTPALLRRDSVYRNLDCRPLADVPPLTAFLSSAGFSTASQLQVSSPAAGGSGPPPASLRAASSPMATLTGPLASSAHTGLLSAPAAVRRLPRFS